MSENLLQRITTNVKQCGGRPCIRGLRIRVLDVLEMLGNGWTEQEILEEFPDLEEADIRACLMFTARRVDFARVTT